MKLEKALKEAQKDRMAFYRSGSPAGSRVYVLVQGRAYCCHTQHYELMQLASFTPDDVMAEDWELTTP